MENPGNVRQAMNRMDPRQRGLFAAPWYLGYFANMAQGGAESVTLGGGVGEFGLVHAGMDYAQPWFDEGGGVYPAFHVFRGLADLRDATRLETTATPLREVQAVAAKSEKSRTLWLANLTGEPATVSLEPAVSNGSIFVLDAGNFAAAAGNADAASSLARSFSGSSVALDPYAVACIRAG
jgi:hypothetical protein